MAILYFRLIFLCNNIWTWQSQKKYSKDKWKIELKGLIGKNDLEKTCNLMIWLRLTSF